MKWGGFLMALVCAQFGCGAAKRMSDPVGGGPTFDVLDLSAPDFSVAPIPGDIDSTPATDVRVVLTADNAYAFGWGDAMQVSNLLGRPPTASACDIFCCPVGTGPEEYIVPAAQAPDTGYLYVVAWADNSTTQGLLGQFERGGTPLYTGDAPWEVCATGLTYPTGPANGGPPINIVNAEITRCNDGTGSTTTSSGGWVSSTGAVTSTAVGVLAVGEDNSAAGGNFQIACQVDATGKKGIDAAAKWMWYQPPGNTAPFTTRPTRDFLIFRLKSNVVPIQ